MGSAFRGNSERIRRRAPRRTLTTSAQRARTKINFAEQFLRFFASPLKFLLSQA
jgi:hypothetical protein